MIIFIAALCAVQACKSSRKITAEDKYAANKDSISMDTEELDEVVVKASKDNPYRGSVTRSFDLIHTKLEIKPDWQNQHVYGKATLTLKPYFYPTDSLVLNAKGLDVKSIKLSGTAEALSFTNDSLLLHIRLPKVYTPQNQLELVIDYTAKPNERKSGGSAAITDDKGLYFINPTGKDPNKPTQLWSQGETESNSCWFPTIDAPNERATSEIAITCEKKYTTLSNGLLISSTNNADSTKTDYWKMDQPHAPYLIMIAVGEFAVVKDKWRNIAVDYYVEKEYAPYAKDIFGNTPEMLEFFSTKLGYTYPWKKYAQVVVRDYVSGAMENTTATLFGEFQQRTKRELLDRTNEDIVAHELFHQWFGDVVTCESWSNIPLNESFATYGEYLWAEYKYGKGEAQKQLYSNLNLYVEESQNKNENLVRFYYDDKEDMFDRHSYEKGSLILNMLRHEVGDEAFFKSLQLYLRTNEFKSVEIHNLRLAFEEVTGRDLNWFFNQWFLGKGHPKLNIKYEYKNDSAVITIAQKHNVEDGFNYILPFNIAVWVNNEAAYIPVKLTKAEQRFAFAVAGKPSLIDVDPDRILLCERKENKTTTEYVYQFNHATHYRQKHEAIRYTRDQQKDSAEVRAMVIKAANDTFYGLRSYAIEQMKASADSITHEYRAQQITSAASDKNPAPRAAAINKLGKLNDSTLIPVFEKALGDSSYRVVANALEAIENLDTALALKMAMRFEGEKNDEVTDAVSSIYSANGDSTFQKYYEKQLVSATGYGKYTLMYHYANFLTRMNAGVAEKGIASIKDHSLQSDAKLLYGAGKGSIKRVLKSFETKKKEAEKDKDDAKVKEYESIIAMANEAIELISKKTEPEKKD